MPKGFCNWLTSSREFYEVKLTARTWQITFFCFLGADLGVGEEGVGDEKWVRMLVVPFSGQSQRSGTFYGV